MTKAKLLESTYTNLVGSSQWLTNNIIGIRKSFTEQFPGASDFQELEEDFFMDVISLDEAEDLLIDELIGNTINKEGRLVKYLVREQGLKGFINKIANQYCFKYGPVLVWLDGNSGCWWLIR